MGDKQKPRDLSRGYEQPEWVKILKKLVEEVRLEREKEKKLGNPAK